MMRPLLSVRLSILLAAVTSLAAVASTAAQTGLPPGQQSEYDATAVRYSSNQLDNLVGPVALYPDPLLAQVLIAATFPDQVEEAARYVRSYGTDGIDDQPWDISVRSVAHYPSALNTLAEKIDWTATLGMAYAYQSSDVMAAVQRMRRLAAQQGNLTSGAQQQVLVENENYVIVPAQSRVIYVPVYDPIVIYSRPVFNLGLSSRYWSFGVGFPIGGWLSYDLDWRDRLVYYNGWNSAYYGHGGGWRVRSRPFVHITNIYVNSRYRTVYYNRDFNRRRINFHNVDLYAGYHRDTWFDNRYNDPRYDPRRIRDRERDVRDGRNREGDPRSRGEPRTERPRTEQPRTAQPRNGQPAATPDGYSNGRRPTGAPEVRRGPERAAPNQPRSPRPQVEAPVERRAEPITRRAEPITRRAEPITRRAEPVAQPRRAEPVAQPRRAEPVAQPRRAEPVQSRRVDPVPPRRANPVAQPRRAEPVTPPRRVEPVKRSTGSPTPAKARGKKPPTNFT